MKTVKSDLNGFFEVRMDDIEKGFFAKKIKLGQMNYYGIKHRDGDHIMYLWLDKNSKAIIKFYRNYLAIPSLYEKLLFELSKDYKSIKIEVDALDIDTINVIKEKSTILEETETFYKEYKFIIYTIDLTNITETNDEYIITKYTYEEYLELEEEHIKNSELYNEIKLGKTKVYNILDDDKKLIDMFTVSTDRKQHIIYIEENIIVIPGVLKSIAKELVKDYEYVVFNILGSSAETIKILKETYSSVEDITAKSGLDSFGLQFKVKLK